MKRRGFLQACLAAATAPYVVTTAGVLMPVRKVIPVLDSSFTVDEIRRIGAYSIEHYMREVFEECERQQSCLILPKHVRLLP